MLLNINTRILVYFGVSEVTDNAVHESLYRMKVFAYDPNLLCFQFG